MRQLSGLDAAFLCLETPSTPMHTIGVLLLGAGTPQVSLGRVRALLLDRMHLLPQLRQKLVELPFGLGRPVFVDDPAFDINRHLEQFAWIPPRNLADLDRATGLLASEPLDRARPLWHAWFFDGLEGGASALVFKLHHAIVDGVSAAMFLAQLLDTEPAPAHPALPVASQRASEHLPGRAALMARTLRNQLAMPMNLARTAVGVAGGVSDLWTERKRVESDGSSWPLPLAPHTGFDGSLSAKREVARGSASLEDFRFIRKAFAATVNDVLLSVCTVALRRHLAANGRVPGRPLVASIPVSIRKGDDEAGGNRVSNMLVRLPVQLEGAADVMRFVRQETRDAKRAHELIGSRLLGPALDAAPMPAFRWLARQHERLGLANFHPPACNIIVSNIPGPPLGLYCAGVPVLAVHPFGPLVDGTALNLTALSYAGRMDLGLIACPTRTPDAAQLVAGIEGAVVELRDVAEQLGRRPIPPWEPAARRARKPKKRESSRSCSPTVEIDMFAEGLLSGERSLCTTGRFVLVAVDTASQPVPVSSGNAPTAARPASRATPDRSRQGDAP